jgi:hypothetical protein
MSIFTFSQRKKQRKRGGKRMAKIQYIMGLHLCAGVGSKWVFWRYFTEVSFFYHVQL